MVLCITERVLWNLSVQLFKAGVTCCNICSSINNILATLLFDAFIQTHYKSTNEMETLVTIQLAFFALYWKNLFI